MENNQETSLNPNLSKFSTQNVIIKSRSIHDVTLSKQISYHLIKSTGFVCRIPVGEVAHLPDAKPTAAACRDRWDG